MDLISIGEAAAQLRMSPSALRYYDERGLVCPRARQAGRRMYGSEELRRLAFIKIAHRLGLPLDTAAAVLDAPGPEWRQTVRQQIAQLDEVIAQAQGAQLFLTHALHCPTDHPARECTTMIGALDRLVGGGSVEQLAAEHVPPGQTRQRTSERPRVYPMVHYRDPGTIAFDAEIERPDQPGAYVTFPFDALDVFGVRARVPVKVRFDDSVDYTGSLAPYGGKHRLGVLKAIQKSLGKSHGDTIHVELRLDTERAEVVSD